MVTMCLPDDPFFFYSESMPERLSRTRCFPQREAGHQPAYGKGNSLLATTALARSISLHVCAGSKLIVG